MRNTLRYVPKKYWSQITREMREIYTAPSLPASEVRFAEFAEQWRDMYPGDDRLLGEQLERVHPFLEFPPELRKVVYTTNAIESLNARFRRIVGISPTNKRRSRCSTLSPTSSDRTGPISSAASTAGNRS